MIEQNIYINMKKRKRKMKLIGILGMMLLVAGCFLIQPAIAVSMEEVQNFLVNDTTNEQIYNNQQMPYYTCGHFTHDLIANASKEGIKMSPVYLNSKTGCDHIIAAAKVNNTWVFIEPINDSIYPEWALKSYYRIYRIGEYVRCSPYSCLSRVNGFIEMGMW